MHSPIAGKLLPSFYTAKGIQSPGTTSQMFYAPESVTSTTSPVGKGIPPTFQCFLDKGSLSQVSSDPDSPYYTSKSVTLFRVESTQNSVNSTVNITAHSNDESIDLSNTFLVDVDFDNFTFPATKLKADCETLIVKQKQDASLKTLFFPSCFRSIVRCLSSLPLSSQWSLDKEMETS